MIFGLSEAVGGSALLLAIISLGVNWRHRYVRRREDELMRSEIERRHQECLEKFGRFSQECLESLHQFREDLEESERNAQSNAELLRDGRLNVSVRSRALRMLRTGMSAETAASELGMARSEVRLLQKVAAVLAPRS